MHKNKKCGCGCEQKKENNCQTKDYTLSADEKDFLAALNKQHYLPLSRFVITSSTNHDVYIIALAPVYISETSKDMQSVKAVGKILTGLEEKGLLSLDYHIPIEMYSYEEYQNSELYVYFVQTVNEAKNNVGFLGDTPNLELGSVALTKKGESLFK